MMVKHARQEEEPRAGYSQNVQSHQLVAPGPGGSNGFVQQRQGQHHGIGHAPHPLHTANPSSVHTTAHPGTAREGRLLEPSCPDPDPARSSCSIYQAVCLDSQQCHTGALSAQSWEQQLVHGRAPSPFPKAGVPGQQHHGNGIQRDPAPSSSIAAGLEKSGF